MQGPCARCVLYMLFTLAASLPLWWSVFRYLMKGKLHNPAKSAYLQRERRVIANSMSVTLFPLRFQQSTQLPSYFVFVDAIFFSCLEASFHFSLFFLKRQIAQCLQWHRHRFPSVDLKREVACDLRSNSEKAGLCVCTRVYLCICFYSRTCLGSKLQEDLYRRKPPTVKGPSNFLVGCWGLSGLCRRTLTLMPRLGDNIDKVIPVQPEPAVDSEICYAFKCFNWKSCFR